MAEGNWSVIRVEKISAEGAQKTERHNERKNESYANLNVDTERIARNVHFKDTGGLTYNEYFQRLIDEGKISTRGQKAGATIFNELVIDVNTRYFEEHGGYEYAKLAAGVISLKRLLNHYFLRNWSSKMIKKSLEAYFLPQERNCTFLKTFCEKATFMPLRAG